MMVREALKENREMRVLLKDGRLRHQLSDELKASIEIVLSAYQSHRNPEGYSYLSMPITSGKLMYEVFEKHGVVTLDELMAKDKGILYNEIIRPNIDKNTAVADAIAKKTKKTIIAPAVFEAKKQRWSQEAYMFLWYRVLEEIVDETVMTDGWQYSNGGVQEFVRAHEIKFNYALSPRWCNDLPIYVPRSYWDLGKKTELKKYSDTMSIVDENLEVISLCEGAELISNAIVEMEKKGFNPKKLKESLIEIGGLAQCHETYKDGWQGHKIEMPWKINHVEVYNSIRKIEPHFRSYSERNAQ